MLFRSPKILGVHSDNGLAIGRVDSLLLHVVDGLARVLKTPIGERILRG